MAQGRNSWRRIRASSFGGAGNSLSNIPGSSRVFYFPGRSSREIFRSALLRRLINAATLRRKGRAMRGVYLLLPVPTYSPLVARSPVQGTPWAMLLCSNCLNAGVNWKLSRIVTHQPYDPSGPHTTALRSRPLVAVAIAVLPSL